VILGAGAAGLMCAIEAGRRGLRVALLERAEKAGKKILISGGGRCNFTNLHCGPENFLSVSYTHLDVYKRQGGLYIPERSKPRCLALYGPKEIQDDDKPIGDRTSHRFC